jgi:hypothetical protein
LPKTAPDSFVKLGPIASLVIYFSFVLPNFSFFQILGAPRKTICQQPFPAEFFLIRGALKSSNHSWLYSFIANKISF